MEAQQIIHAAFTGGADGIGGSAGAMVFRGKHLYGTAVAGGISMTKGVIYESRRRPKPANGDSRRSIRSRANPTARFPMAG